MKENGLGMTVACDDAAGNVRNIENDITNLDWTMPSEPQDITGLDKSAMERILLLADFSLNLNGVFNSAANMSHDVFKDVGITSVTRTVTIVHSGMTLPNEILFGDYNVSRAANGALTWQTPGQLNSTTVPTWAG